MEKVEAIMEKYEGSFRITPERPTASNKGKSGCRKIKAELFHWAESDAMDIYIMPPPNPTRATTQVVKRWPWGGSVSRSIYGQYTLRYSPPLTEPPTSKQVVEHISEMYRWMEDDKKTFQPQAKPIKKKK